MSKGQKLVRNIKRVFKHSKLLATSSVIIAPIVAITGGPIIGTALAALTLAPLVACLGLAVLNTLQDKKYEDN